MAERTPEPPDAATTIRERFGLIAPALIDLARQTLNRYHLRPADADDVTQAALLAATRSLPQFRGRADEELLRWFGSILRHHLVDFIRADRRRQLREGVALSEAEPAAPDADEPRFIDEMLGDLRAATDRLPVRQRRALELYFYHGQSLDAIGKSLGVSADAARMIKSRALARLRSLLQRGGADKTG